MTLTTRLILAALMIVFAIYGFQEIGKSITERANDTAKQIQEDR